MGDAVDAVWPGDGQLHRARIAATYHANKTIRVLWECDEAIGRTTGTAVHDDCKGTRHYERRQRHGPLDANLVLRTSDSRICGAHFVDEPGMSWGNSHHNHRRGMVSFDLTLLVGSCCRRKPEGVGAQQLLISSRQAENFSVDDRMGAERRYLSAQLKLMSGHVRGVRASSIVIA